MASGGYRPGSGRPRGTKAGSPKVIKAESVLKAGLIGTRQFASALDFVMHVINDADAEMPDKIRLAIAAMPFQHAKLIERTSGKKDLAMEAARTAGDGTEWGDDLAGPDSRLN